MVPNKIHTGYKEYRSGKMQEHHGQLKETSCVPKQIGRIRFVCGFERGLRTLSLSQPKLNRYNR